MNSQIQKVIQKLMALRNNYHIIFILFIALLVLRGLFNSIISYISIALIILGLFMPIVLQANSRADYIFRAFWSGLYIGSGASILFGLLQFAQQFDTYGSYEGTIVVIAIIGFMYGIICPKIKNNKNTKEYQMPRILDALAISLAMISFIAIIVLLNF